MTKKKKRKIKKYIKILLLLCIIIPVLIYINNTHKDNDNIMVFDNRKELMVNVNDVKETTTVSAGMKLFNTPLNAILI